MGNTKYIPTTLEHITHVAENMRQGDREEIMASHGQSPMEALLTGVRVSDVTVTVTTEEGEALVIMGVSPVCRLTGTGAPWLLGTEEALKYRRNFAKDPDRILKLMLDLYPNLENYVHVKNRISVRWLKFIGFRFDDPVILPQSGEKFMRFYMIKES